MPGAGVEILLLLLRCESQQSFLVEILLFSIINNMSAPNTATPVGLAAPTKKPVSVVVPQEQQDTTHTPSQRYLSTRGGSYGVRDAEAATERFQAD